VVLLVKTGMVSVVQLKQVRPYAIVGAFIIGAIFTPPDVVSQIMLAVPLWLLYELGIVVAGLVSKPAGAVEGYRPLTEPEADNIEASQKKRSE
jgi:sec-independent protein translocase protein TatC